ncbi:putative palmitoyl-CoA hydrolase [Helianthus anomalus]
MISSILMFLQLSSMEELQEAHLTNPRLPRTYRNKVATTKVIHWPVEIRLCEHNNSTNYDKRPARSTIVHGSINKLSLLHPLQHFLRYWFRSNGKLSSDENLHRCVAAYTSDHITLNVSLNPHRRKGLKTSSASLCHSMWFHRPIKADEWLLFSVSDNKHLGSLVFLMYGRPLHNICYLMYKLLLN